MAVLKFTVIRVYDTFVFKIYAEPSTYLVLIANCILKKMFTVDLLVGKWPVFSWSPRQVSPCEMFPFDMTSIKIYIYGQEFPSWYDFLLYLDLLHLECTQENTWWSE